MPGRRLLLVFLKWPEPGRVKTRLGAEIGLEQAATVYRQLTETVLGQIPQEQPVRIVYAPSEKEREMQGWLEPELAERVGGHDYEPQVEGDLGTRLEAAFGGALAEGWEQVMVIGTDCVEITPMIYEEAWGALEKEGAEVVIGPALDGGYYLLGMQGPMKPEVFRGVPWSASNTAEVTMDRAREAGLRVVKLSQVLSDVDTAADWKRLQERGGIGL